MKTEHEKVRVKEAEKKFRFRRFRIYLSNIENI
jgi:hypothetical protein